MKPLALAAAALMAASSIAAEKTYPDLTGVFGKDAKTIGIGAISSLMPAAKLAHITNRLAKAGYRVKIAPNVMETQKAAPERRARLVEELWLDPEVDVLTFAVGGQGAAEVIELLDWEKLKTRDMKVIGFSDLTLLVNTMLAKGAGHPYTGPVLTTLSYSNENAVKRMRDMMAGCPSKVKLTPVKAGKATVSGLAMGGLLDRLDQLVKRNLMPDASGRVVFIENTNKYAPRTEEMLGCLRSAGVFDKAAAVVICDFNSKQPAEETRERLEKFAASIPCPVYSGYPYGHISNTSIIDFRRRLAISPDGTLSWAHDKKTDFNRLVREVSEAGGGRVTVPAGRHVVGQIDLLSNVELHLEKGAILEGAQGMENYRILELPYSEGTWSAVISAVGATNVAVTGEGEIFGNGAAWPQPLSYGGNQEGTRPRGLFFADCKDVRLSGFKLRDAACWGIVFKRCDGVVARGIKIDSHSNANNDGFDIEAKNVLIADCDIDSGDDAVCLKSNDPGFTVENVVVSNVTARSHCCSLKLGTASHGTMRNVLFVDCRTEAPRRDFTDMRPDKKGRPWFMSIWRKRFPGLGDEPQTGLSAVTVENVDGGTVENITYRNITANGICVPIFVRGGRRLKRSCGTPPSDKCIFRNVTIENVTGAALSGVACSITGVDECRAKNITLRNVKITCRGLGADVEIPASVPEAKDRYPECNMFESILPAYGLYARHVDGLVLDNASFVLRKGDTDRRPAIVKDDVNP